MAPSNPRNAVRSSSSLNGSGGLPQGLRPSPKAQRAGVRTLLSPGWGWNIFPFAPTPYGVGCSLSPLRGYEPLPSHEPARSSQRALLKPLFFKTTQALPFQGPDSFVSCGAPGSAAPQKRFDLCGVFRGHESIFSSPNPRTCTKLPRRARTRACRSRGRMVPQGTGFPQRDSPLGRRPSSPQASVPGR